MCLNIENKTVKAFIDTGAARSCVSINFVNNLNLKIFELSNNEPKFLVSASGELLKIFGTVKLHDNIKAVHAYESFLVLYNLTSYVIIGDDLLDHWKCVIYCSRRTV